MGNSNDMIASPSNYHDCPKAINDYDVDPTKNYPEEYIQFMTNDCKWHPLGQQGRELYDVDMGHALNNLKEQQVTEII